MLKEFLLVSLAISAVSASTYSIGATGTVLCKGQPAKGLKIIMKDGDKIICSTVTGVNGSFHFAGTTSHWFHSAKAKLVIEHKCGHIRTKEAKVVIPSAYVVDGKVPTKYFDISRFELHK